jgi:FXSXX-COOH protein
MRGKPGRCVADVPDLADLSLEEILEGTDSALSQALGRVLRQLEGEEAPVAAYDSGGDSLPDRLGPDGPGA